MQNPRIQSCSSCHSLKELYDEIECSILDLIKKRWNNVKYNTTSYFNQELFDDLVRYKRVVYRRLFNPAYPAEGFDSQDIITQVRLRVYKNGDCSQCANCFPSNTPPPTTTFTTTYTTV